jgi:signal transduction histidine kinase
MKKIPFLLSLVGGFFIILISIYGFSLLLQRPGLPAEIKDLFQKEDAKLIQIDDIRIERKMDMEFILSQKTIGEQSTFLIEIDGKIEKKEAKFVYYYSQSFFPLIYLLIGIFSFIIAIVVFLFRAEDARARIYYWTSFAFASAVIISGGFYCLRKSWLSYIPGVLYYFCYPLAAALFLHFSLSFSKIRLKISKLIIYFPALIFIGVLEITFLQSGLNSSIEAHRIYESAFYVFRGYLVLFVLSAILSLVNSYRKASLEEQKGQIKWIFYGLFVGLVPFILLYQLPLSIGINSLLSEELSNAFFIFVPLAFAFSIVKFRLMNIELVINRSIVYSILTVFTVSIYLFSVYLLGNIFSKFFSARETTVSLIGALSAAVAFNPARKKIQAFVDKAFFRTSYDYRKSILSFNEKAHKMASSDHLTDFFLLKIKKILPMEHIGVFIYLLVSGKKKLLIAKNGKENLASLISLNLDSEKMLARKKAVLMEEGLDFSKESFLEEKNLELIIPLSFRSAALAGYVSLGKKKSGERYTRDDLELLLTMTLELALNLERIRLQEEVFEERAEREKLDELNRLKTEFVSSVSHELRTPMSSIRGLAEVLQAGKIKNKAKQDELISLVADESGRLSRFLHNILDYGKIEQQTKTYNFQNVEIQSVVRETVKLFLYRLELDGFVLQTNLPENPLFLKIDTDAVKQALTNLIDNANKYSSDKKDIMIQVIEKEKQVEIQVEDKGLGIPSKDREKIFEGFYRHAEAIRHSPKGVGLGLKIVKHIMEAHKGEIKVESQPNRGSTFSLIFPKP